MMRAARALAVVLLGAVTLTGCVGAKSTPFSKGPELEQGELSEHNHLPILVEMKMLAKETYTRVYLYFDPGEVEPTIDIKELPEPVVPVPGSGESVRLRGTQALQVTVSSARIDKVNVAPILREDPAISEVHVIASSEDSFTLGVGIRGEGEARPMVDEREHAEGEHHSESPERDVFVITLRNPEHRE